MLRTACALSEKLPLKTRVPTSSEWWTVIFSQVPPTTSSFFALWLRAFHSERRYTFWLRPVAAWAGFWGARGSARGLC